jgi:nucleoside-diphosphate-sugar epimerase
MVGVVGVAGVIGRQLVPLLVAPGHEVVAMTHKESNRAMLEQLSGTALVADALVNPDKLTHLGPVADFQSLVRSAK